MRRLRAARREEEILLRGQRFLRREDDRFVGPDPGERPGTLLLAEDQRGAALGVTARDERGVTGEAQMFDDREHVVAEAVPRVVGIGRVAVAVAAEVERPDVAARGDEALGDGFPHQTVKSRRVTEQYGPALAAPVVDDERDPVGVE